MTPKEMMIEALTNLLGARENATQSNAFTINGDMYEDVFIGLVMALDTIREAGE